MAWASSSPDQSKCNNLLWGIMKNSTFQLHQTNIKNPKQLLKYSGINA
jgi:hypothetical protein